ncbi:ATP-binding protein [Dechloromonas sp. ZY10]|uniref:PAS domain-containing sensor histidine kinase n=1 Tax=Dechloromonas aquae TaxID=2664436 RepID=UPI00352872B9
MPARYRYRPSTPDLAASRERLLAVLDALPDAVIISDAEGCILRVNQPALALFGYAAGELLGQSFACLVPESWRSECLAGRDAWLAAAEQGVRSNVPARRRDGSEFIADLSLAVTAVRNQRLLVATLRDASQRLRNEAELVAAREAAEQASLAKTAFLASMSHELRTPLNAVIGFAELLALGQPEPVPLVHRDAVRYILSSGRHLLAVVNDVLDLARIESGKLALSPVCVQVRGIADEVLAMLQGEAQRRGIALRHSAYPELCAQADPARLRQLLLNLVSNAIKYNRDGGYVSLSCRVRGPWLRLSVTDTGMGIPQSRRAELFQPFKRLGREQSSIEGTGVGLVLCRQLIEAMGGRLNFESEEGVGSRFWIDLPLDKCAEDCVQRTAG